MKTFIGIQVLCFTLILFSCRITLAEEMKTKDVEVRIGIGAKSIFGAGWAGLPMPISVHLNVDYGRLFRVHGEMTHHLAEGINNMSLGAGVALKLYGKDAPKNGGFQMKFPIIAEIGILSGTIEAGDGYNDDISWFLIGASTGVDFTWWAADGAGFWLSLNIGYMFRVEAGSDYTTSGYSSAEDGFSTQEASLILGIAF